MQNLRLLLPLLALLAAPFGAAAETDVEGARKADDLRVAAVISADRGAMAAVFSDDMVYTHSTGKVNHKADFIAGVADGSMHYLTVSYEARDFRAVAPGLVLMTGRCHITNLIGGKSVPNYLSFLAVYRNEKGVWRFLAWQSCHLTADSPPFHR